MFAAKTDRSVADGQQTARADRRTPAPRLARQRDRGRAAVKDGGTAMTYLIRQ